MSGSVEEIAGKLTEAQRRFLRRRYAADRRGYWPMYNALARKGLVRNEFMTHLGEKVAALLLEQSGDAQVTARNNPSPIEDGQPE